MDLINVVGSSALKSCIHNKKQDFEASLCSSLEEGSFLKTTCKNVTFKHVLKASFFISCSLKCLESRACSNISTSSIVILSHAQSRLFFRASFTAILNEAICTIKAYKVRNVNFGNLDKPFAVCSGRPDTWANTAAQ